MDEICRLCLTVSNDMACKLGEELKILNRLSSINVQIKLDDTLPSNVCRACFQTLEDIQNFRENVTQNEYKLAQILSSGRNLDNYYHNLKNKNVFIEIVKIEVDDEDRYSEALCEPMDTSNKDIMQINSINNCYNVKNNAVKRENESDESNTLNISIGKLKNLNKRKSKNNGAAKVRKERSSKSKSENTIEVKNYTESIEINPSANILEPNTVALFTNQSNNQLSEIEITINTENAVKIKDHKCLTCFEYLSSHLSLIKHYKTVHNIYNNVDIENCNESEFAVITSEGKDAECEVSSRSENNDDKAKNGTSKQLERPYNCKLCGRTFASVYAIVRHGRAHSDRHLHCSHGCGYSTVYRGALKDHEKRHEKDFRYKCATCGAGFHVKTWHEQHQNIHNNVKPFVCDVCGMAFHMHRYLTSHRTAVHSNVAKGINRYICPHCDNAFINIHSFKSHLEEHKGKRNFLCDLCGKVCASGEQLKYHRNSHLGLKPFSCSICNKKFAKKFNLTVHERAHAGQKHLCQACGKHYAQRSTLLRHHRKRHPDNTKDKNMDDKKMLSYSSY